MIGLMSEMKATTAMSILSSMRQRGLSADAAASITGVEPERMRALVETRDLKGWSVDELGDVLDAIDASGPRYGGGHDGRRGGGRAARQGTEPGLDRGDTRRGAGGEIRAADGEGEGVMELRIEWEQGHNRGLVAGPSRQPLDRPRVCGCPEGEARALELSRPGPPLGRSQGLRGDPILERLQAGRRKGRPSVVHRGWIDG